MQKRIFHPLGTAGANFSVREALKIDDRAALHVRRSGKVETIDSVTPTTNISKRNSSGFSRSRRAAECGFTASKQAVD